MLFKIANRFKKIKILLIKLLFKEINEFSVLFFYHIIYNLIFLYKCQLHFKNISISNKRSDNRRLDGRKMEPPTLNTLSTATLEAGTVKTLLVYEANSGHSFSYFSQNKRVLSKICLNFYLYLYLQIICILFKYLANHKCPSLVSGIYKNCLFYVLPILRKFT